jgi:galactoside O-acetyltransferase
MQLSRYLMLVLNEARAYLDAIVSALPGVSGGKFRVLRLRAILASLGPSAIISTGIQILGAESIHIGPRFFCGKGCSLYADGGGKISIGERVALNADVSLNAAIGGQIYIGDNVLVGPRVLMRATDHAFSRTDVPIWQQGHVPGVIRIEDDVWIGGNVTILAGSTIGKGAVVAAGAVVNNDVPAYSVVGGVPARHLKWRGSPPTSADVLKKEIEK